MTLNLISPKARRVVREKINFEQMPARFGEGTFGRIDAVLEAGENRSDFLRAAVEREIKRRERAKPKDAD